MAQKEVNILWQLKERQQKRKEQRRRQLAERSENSVSSLVLSVQKQKNPISANWRRGFLFERRDITTRVCVF